MVRTSSISKIISRETMTSVVQHSTNDEIPYWGWDVRLVGLKRLDFEHLANGGVLLHDDGEYVHIIILDEEKGTDGP